MEMERAPNPWTEDGGPLPGAASPLDSEQILDRIRKFLRAWPGKMTSLVDDEERHDRLVRTIAGYPSIRPADSIISSDVTPHDAPLDIEGIQCFEMTLSLDSLPSILGTSSLWTDIVEFEYQNCDWHYDTRVGNIDPKESPMELVDTVNSLPEMLGRDLLSTGLFPQDAEDELRVGASKFIESKATKKHNKMEPKERTTIILALLFLGLGEDQQEKHEIPNLSREAQALLAEMFSYTNEGLREWHNVVKRMRTKAASVGKLEFQEFNTTTHEIKRIKSWMKEILPGADRKEGQGLSQTYLRGASSLVGLYLDSQRKDHTNYCDILIDGGGRLMTKQEKPNSFLLRANEFEDGLLETHFGIRLPMEGDPSLNLHTEGDFPDLKYILGPWEFYSTSGLVGAIGPLQNAHSNYMGDPYRENKWDDPKHEPDPRHSAYNITPHKVLVHLQEPEPPASLGMLLTQIKDRDFPGRRHFGARVVPPWDPACPRCNQDMQLSYSERGNILSGNSDLCFAHIILHKIGHAQRTKDSALRQPSKESGEVVFPPPQREVCAIARIDGNSVGWLLNLKRLDPTKEQISDAIRRKSMRFNAHWWSALSKAMHDENVRSPDTVACWVSAGDDIMLAEYSENSDMGHENPPGEALVSTLKRLADNLNGGLNEELGQSNTGPLATFAAGVAIRGESGISGMLEVATDLEAAAKREWKTRHSGTPSPRIMISQEKIDRESVEAHRMLLPGPDQWGDDELMQIADEHSLDVKDKDDLAKLQQICFRGELIWEGEFKVLIPEKKAGTEDCPEHTTLPLPLPRKGPRTHASSSGTEGWNYEREKGRITNLILIEKPH